MFSSRQGGFSQIPTIVKNIIIINVLFFLLQNVLGDKADMYLALHYWESPYFRWWQLFTHMFMHANVGHIFFNMFALWMFGSILENVFGPKRFLIFYLVCGLGAAICHLSVLGFEFHKLHAAFLYYQEHPSLTSYAQFLKRSSFTEEVFMRVLSFWQQNPDCTDCAQQSIQFINQKYALMLNEATVGLWCGVRVVVCLWLPVPRNGADAYFPAHTYQGQVVCGRLCGNRTLLRHSEFSRRQYCSLCPSGRDAVCLHSAARLEKPHHPLELTNCACNISGSLGSATVANCGLCANCR
jgi:hypothetical protein